MLGCAIEINHPALGLPPLNYGNLQVRRSGPFFAKLVNITQITMVYSTEKKTWASHADWTIIRPFSYCKIIHQQSMPGDHDVLFISRLWYPSGKLT